VLPLPLAMTHWPSLPSVSVPDVSLEELVLPLAPVEPLTEPSVIE